MNAPDDFRMDLKVNTADESLIAGVRDAVAGLRATVEAGLAAAEDELAEAEDEQALLAALRDALNRPNESTGMRLAVAAGNIAVALLAGWIDLSEFSAIHPGTLAWSPGASVALAILTAIAFRWRRMAVLT